MVPIFFIIISVKKVLIWLIYKYQINISPIFGHRCRFHVTCSQYSIQSIQKFGILQGLWKTLIQILQCHPIMINEYKDTKIFLYLNSQDIINMSSPQRYLFIIIFVIISFMLWQTWQTENYQNTHTKIIHTHNNINHSSCISNNHEKNVIHNEKHIITVKTDVFLLKINMYGGDIEELYLTNYLKNLNSIQPLRLLYNSPQHTYQVNSGIINTHALNTSQSSTKKILYTTLDHQNTYILSEKENTLQINLISKDINGITYIKEYHFNRNNYAIYVNHSIQNMSTCPIQIKLFGNITQTINTERLNHENNDNEDSFPLYSYRGAAYSTNKEKYQKYSFADIKDKNLYVHTNTGWIAMLQKYFVTAWIPNDHMNNIFYTTPLNDNNVIIGFKSDPIYIPIGKKTTLQSILWVGPKLQDNMKIIAPHLNLVIDYGWLWFISQPLFQLLRFTYYYVGNWGISIIIITLSIRLIMYPLTKAQYTSMAKIRMLQPKISLIQQEYKHDKYQYHQKTIELYKKEKVNPLGGCLPLLIQMPIFLALYYMLSGSVELRHAKFAFWIHDLSSKDPYYILPILMGMTMFFIQKISPTTITDPIQKKVMNITLVIFTIFFLWFPSGLVLYYIISNIITIIQQQIIYYELRKKGQI